MGRFQWARHGYTTTPVPIPWKMSSRGADIGRRRFVALALYVDASVIMSRPPAQSEEMVNNTNRDASPDRSLGGDHAEARD